VNSKLEKQYETNLYEVYLEDENKKILEKPLFLIRTPPIIKNNEVKDAFYLVSYFEMEKYYDETSKKKKGISCELISYNPKNKRFELENYRASIEFENDKELKSFFIKPVIYWIPSIDKKGIHNLNLGYSVSLNFTNNSKMELFLHSLISKNENEMISPTIASFKVPEYKKYSNTKKLTKRKKKERNQVTKKQIKQNTGFKLEEILKDKLNNLLNNSKKEN
jgi:hypothetical protein